LGIGAIFKAVWVTFKARWSQFIIIGLVGSVLSSAVAVLCLVPWFSSFLLSIQALDFENAIKTFPLLVGAIMVVSSLIVIVASVMICGVADGVGRGLRPSYGELFQRGLRAIPRAILPLLLVGVGSALSLALFSTWMKTMVDQVIDGNRSAMTQSMLLGLLAMSVGSMALSVLIWLLEVRLFLFAPILYSEESSGFAALSRSWKLSKGASGRILLIFVIFSMAAAVIGQVFTFPLSISLSTSRYSVYSLSEFFAEYLSQNLGWLIICALAITVLDTLVRVLLSISSVVFYHDQLRMKGEVTPSTR
jgi:hypothetical protein